MPSLRSSSPSIREIGEAVRNPGELADRWCSRETDASAFLVIGLLLTNAVLGTAAYGMTMQMHRGLGGMLEGAFFMPLAAGLSWSMSLPALFIGKRLLGSKLSLRSALMTASITVSFGSSALLASVPVNWFFTLATPWEPARLLVNLVIFSGVGFCMRDVFWRVAERLFDDGPGLFSFCWLTLHVVLGIELFIAFGVFSF
jgi:hypothetical protein